MLSRTQTPKEHDLFRVPYACSISWTEFINIYPSITIEMTGDCIENSLSFYYQRNVLTSIYEFVDESAEHDIADIIGIDLNITMTGETKDNMMERMKSEKNKCEDVTINIHEFLNDTDEETQSLKDEKNVRKQNKKERRMQKLKERSASISVQ